MMTELMMGLLVQITIAAHTTSGSTIRETLIWVMILAMGSAPEGRIPRWRAVAQSLDGARHQDRRRRLLRRQSRVVLKSQLNGAGWTGISGSGFADRSPTRRSAFAVGESRGMLWTSMFDRADTGGELQIVSRRELSFDTKTRELVVRTNLSIGARFAPPGHR